MERPAKRQRLFTPLESRFVNGFHDEHEHHETPIRLRREEEEEEYDPDRELRQRRAQLDRKLRSTFESIFDKYGRDFDGIADEIDLYTGEILVNNGHLVDMQDERDAGISESGRDMSGSTTSETEEITNSSFEEEDEIDEEDDEEEGSSDEDMIEDDMILRGFAQASQFMQRQLSSEPAFSAESQNGSLETPRRSGAVRSTLKPSGLPSHSEIMSQFGPELGPEIVKYVEQQGAFKDTGTEKERRGSLITTTMGRKRPKERPILALPEIERSPSPENGGSIWAPERKVRPRGPPFTEEDDQLLFEFVTNARRNGLDLSSQVTWKRFEATVSSPAPRGLHILTCGQHPHHLWNSWKLHYRRKFKFLSKHADESELSTSETSAGLGRAAQQMNHEEHRVSAVGVQRPTRIRKPAERDPNIISWSDAVPILESGDPYQHAALLRDARRTDGDASFRFDHPTPASSNVPETHLSQKDPLSNHRLHQYLDISKSARQLRNPEERRADGKLAPYHPSSFIKTAERLPCPHARCQNYSSATYRTQRYYNEELSPLSLHLLHVHHTTPYPCSESNCERTGDKGFFMQIELVMHVKQAHPYPTALSRLRGRVDPELLDRNFDSRRPFPPIDTQRPYMQGAPRDSDFLFAEMGTLTSINQQPPSTPDPDRTLTPGEAQRQAGKSWPDGSSLRVNPSPATGREVQPIYIEEDDADSDVQILDANPFLDQNTCTEPEKVYPCPFKNPLGCEKGFNTASSAALHAKFHSSEKAQCSYPKCQEGISTTEPDLMKTHLEWHEQQLSRSLAQGAPEPYLQPLMHSSIPDSQDSHVEWTSSVPVPISSIKHVSTKKPIALPLPRNTVDPSYEFSDDEDLVQPAATIVPVVMSDKVAEFVNKEGPAPVPSPAKTPRLFKMQKSSTHLSTSTSPHFPTTPIKQKPPNSMLRGVMDAEDLDELSLATNDFVLISSRPRSGTRPMTGSKVRVKREDIKVQASSDVSGRKRTFSTFDSEELDELAPDEPRSGRSSRLQSRIKIEPGNSAKRRGTVIKPTKTRVKRLSGESTELPSQEETVSGQRPAENESESGTLQINIALDVSSRAQNDTGARSDIAIPSTSDVGSSPADRTADRTAPAADAVPGSSSPLLALLRPVRQKRSAANTLKQEEEDGFVKTPGGTLRRCGEDAFTCGRPFCFKCGSAP